MFFALHAVIKRHKLNGRNVEVKKAVSKQEIGPGGGGGGGRGGGAPRGGRWCCLLMPAHMSLGLYADVRLDHARFFFIATEVLKLSKHPGLQLKDKMCTCTRRHIHNFEFYITFVGEGSWQPEVKVCFMFRCLHTGSKVTELHVGREIHTSISCRATGYLQNQSRVTWNTCVSKQ